MDHDYYADWLENAAYAAGNKLDLALSYGPRTHPSAPHRKVRIYCAGSTALMDVLTLVGINGFKIGVTGTSTAWARITDLRHKRYAGIFKRPGDDADTGRSLAGANEWSLVYLEEKHLRGRALPANVTLENGWILLNVPPQVTVDDVNKAVHGLLKARCLREKFAEKDVQASLARFGFDPGGWFHTRYDRMGSDLRVSAAEEIYEIQPRVELAWLVGELGRMVEDFTKLHSTISG